MLKLDLEKAYNKVNLYGVFCARKGLGSKRSRDRLWLRLCSPFSHPNGSSSGIFAANRGLSQRDHLSRFLFTIVAEAFSY